MSKKIDGLIIEKVLSLNYVHSNKYGFWMDFDGDGCADLFKPSENIKDAWVVIEHLNKEGYMTLVHNADIRSAGVTRGEAEIGDWFANIVKRDNYGDTKERYPVYAKTAPMAICLSALKSVGIEIE